MEYDRKKEVDPLQTITKARTILADLGIMTTENWKHPFDPTKSEPNSFSVRLDAPDYKIGTNGKGSARSYTLASAYGEFMERLQNLILLPMEKLTRESLKEQGFVYFPDEKICNLDDILAADDCFSSAVYKDYYKDTFLLECGVEERKKVVEGYQEAEFNNLDENYVTWPFYSVKQYKTVYIWNRFVTYLHGSNGMCAGNTPAEAIVQGLSEIFERYASSQILINHIIPPAIPEEEYAKYGLIKAIIEEIESTGPFKILVKDCSLGKGLPVCAVILVDTEKQRYRANFGCHPHIPVAIERCLTELLQGYDPANSEDNDAWLISMDMSIDSISSYMNVRNMHTNGMGILPSAFFAGTPSYEHIPFKDVSDLDNTLLLHYCIELALSLSEDVLIRDVSYLGFPAFYIMVPGISYYPTSRKYLRMDSAYMSLADISQYKEEPDETRLKKLWIALNRWEYSSSKVELPFSPMKLKTAVMLMLQCNEDAISYLEYQINRGINVNDKAELGALLKTLRYIDAGWSMEEVEKQITLFYSQHQWENICEKWLCKNPVEKILQDIPEPVCSETDRAVNDLFCRLKKRFAQKTIIQEELRHLFYD